MSNDSGMRTDAKRSCILYEKCEFFRENMAIPPYNAAAKRMLWLVVRRDGLQGMVMRRWIMGLLALCLLSGCAGVSVRSVSTDEYIQMRRGDVLSGGKLSSFTQTALQVLGLESVGCIRTLASCTTALRDAVALDEEQRLSALAELWLQQALALQATRRLRDDITQDDIANAYIETARYAYAYLFMTKRHPSERAFEERQTQVRDYYNYAVQETSALVMDAIEDKDIQANGLAQYDTPIGRWYIKSRIADIADVSGRRLGRLIPASSLGFKGLRNTYRRDGVGAELVVLWKRNRKIVTPWRETPFSATSVIISFPGKTLKEVLSTNQAELTAYDPYQHSEVTMAGQQIPLAADFSSAYGLWLVNSGFALQALRTLLGRGDVLDRPRLYMMQPYDPERKVIIMLHGLGSSPEAWINVANEMLGDEQLRRNYQIWQIYYPTNVPMVFNLHDIRETISETFAHFDPAHVAPASRDIVLIGHSMGGVLSRLLVSSSEGFLWKKITARHSLDDETRRNLLEKYNDYAEFEPLPGVTRAIFIAAPHRGTPVAQYTFARWISSLMALPVSIAEKMQDLTKALLTNSPQEKTLKLPISQTSIDSLSDQDPFIRATENLPVSRQVVYHSIIGNDTPDLPLQQSSDGVVPYSSAHLQGAASEKVVNSWHSVQESPQAILEIRRILHLQLRQIESRDRHLAQH